MIGWDFHMLGSWTLFSLYRLSALEASPHWTDPPLLPKSPDISIALHQRPLRRASQLLWQPLHYYHHNTIITDILEAYRRIRETNKQTKKKKKTCDEVEREKYRNKYIWVVISCPYSCFQHCFFSIAYVVIIIKPWLIIRVARGFFFYVVVLYRPKFSSLALARLPKRPNALRIRPPLIYICPPTSIKGNPPATTLTTHISPGILHGSLFFFLFWH